MDSSTKLSELNGGLGIDRGKIQITDAGGRARYWQRGGGYDRVLWNEEAIRTTVRYIHDNPVRRGLAAVPEDWAWSSARAYRGDPDALVPIDRVA